MHSVIPLILRRMRRPLIVLISAYAVAVLGFALIPGQSADGQPWRMGFFHAFYFVSYMATTIGFGEIPYPFTHAQRMWALFSIYLTVIAWFYSLGSIIGLTRDPAFREALGRARFRRTVERMREPFYLVCGYGDTGSELVEALTARGQRVVTLDIDPDRVNELTITELRLFVPGLVGDANLPANLVAAGLKHPFCVGVVAVTNGDQTNLQIAITSKLLNPGLTVICRAERRSTVANMKSFGTDHVVNPFEAFAVNVVTAMRSADLQRIEEWLTALPGRPLSEPEQPPRGHWIICAYGRAGEALHRHLHYEGVTTTVVDPAALTEPEASVRVRGKGTEAVTLREARVQEATAIFGATHNDADNLSIVMTARELNPELFLVARQNNRSTDAVFAAAKLPLVMTPSRIMAAEILSVLAAPLLGDFLRFSRHQKPEWASSVVESMRTLCAGRTPELWTLSIDGGNAPAVVDALLEGRRITLGMLMLDHRERERTLPVMSLLLRRGDKEMPQPPADQELVVGDRILLCGREGVRKRLNWTVRNHNALNYVETGEQRPDGWLWRHLHRKQKARHTPG